VEQVLPHQDLHRFVVTRIEFRDESDIKQLIKMRTIYELLETITDRCEDVANLIEGIVLENS